MLKTSKVILFFLFLILLISCRSIGYGKDHQMFIPEQVIKDGRIVSESNPVINETDNDIVFSSISFSGLFDFNGNGPGVKFLWFTNMMAKAKVRFGWDNYSVKIKYLYDDYSEGVTPDFYNIKIKGLPDKYKTTVVNSSAMLIHRGVFLHKKIKEYPVPVEITDFSVNEKKFFLLMDGDFGSKNMSVEYFIRYEKPEFYIVDEIGNAYASFNYQSYKLYNQADANEYDFIQLIANYWLIFHLIRRG